MSNALERFYTAQQNVVLRDANGNPNIFVRHAKQQSSELSSNLPAHVHPAFIVNGTTDPAILIGKYQGCPIDGISTYYSIPNAVPAGAPNGGPSMSTCLTNLRRASVSGSSPTYVSGMTIADYGYLMCLAQKYLVSNSKLPMEGNVSNGGWYGVASAWYFNSNTTYAYKPNVGDKCICMGWLYECLQQHTVTSESMCPPDNPALWKRLNRVGGTPDMTTFKLHNRQRGFTLTGSGPQDWYLNRDKTMESDLVGNGTEALYGIRLSNGELQVLENNNAADPTANVFDTATWKAILPNGSGGHTLVNPGSNTGTVKLAKNGSVSFKVVARALTSSDYNNTILNGYFNTITTDIANPPALLYELGILPLPETVAYCTANNIHLGLCKCFILQNQVSYMLGCSGYGDDIYAGLGAYSINMAPTTATQQMTCRPRARETT